MGRELLRWLALAAWLLAGVLLCYIVLTAGR